MAASEQQPPARGRFSAVRNEIFAQHPHPPASATVGTTALARSECRIEIEAIAVIP